jgi:multiple sugar transport system permease protein
VQFEINNYYLAVTLVPFFQYLLNSVILVAITLGFGVITNLIYGFAFARINAPGRNIVFTIVLAQLMIPSIALLIPQYVLFTNIGFKHTYWIWILGGIGGEAFFIFLFRQFFASIPKDFEDAARIDGCNIIGIIFRIFIPMSKSAIAVMAFFSFQNIWGEYMTPFMYLKEEQYPLAMALLSTGYDLPAKMGGRTVPMKEKDISKLTVNLF